MAQTAAIRIQRKESLGGADHGWLKARHHFSFGSYYDPERMGFGDLRVVNDDHIRAGTGFAPHPHKDMEIITYVRSGAILHKDSQGNEGITKAGDVQVMSAGTGITHSEFAGGEEDTTLYQIWILPREKNVAPRWKAAEFPKTFAKDELPLLVSGRPKDAGKGALYIHQDAAIYGGRLQADRTLEHPIIGTKAYLLVSVGEVTLADGSRLHAGDGAEIENMRAVSLKAAQDSEVLIIDLE